MGKKKIFWTEMKDEKDCNKLNGEEHAKEEAQCEPSLGSQGEHLGAKRRDKMYSGSCSMGMEG